MEKNMCYAALGVAGLMALLFLLDLFAGFPFGGGITNGGPFTVIDILGVIASGIVAYLGYSSLKDIR
jgi:hypothetical protein